MLIECTWLLPLDRMVVFRLGSGHGSEALSDGLMIRVKSSTIHGRGSASPSRHPFHVNKDHIQCLLNSSPAPCRKFYFDLPSLLLLFMICLLGAVSRHKKAPQTGNLDILLLLAMA
jgi:hypothetical protein